jgi:hypothetical protein
MRSLAPAFLLTLSACVEPGQYGGPIPVDGAGAAARLARLCSVADQTVCAALPAEVEDVGDAGDAGDADASPSPTSR